MQVFMQSKVNLIDFHIIGLHSANQRRTAERLDVKRGRGYSLKSKNQKGFVNYSN